MDWQPVGATLAVLFWASLGLVAYSYAAYPLFVFFLAGCFGRRRFPPRIAASDWPRVSLLISALNEEKWIEQRILNALAQDYPEDRLEVVIASDGSTDRTAEIVDRLARRFPGRVRLCDFPERRGKATVLNAVMPALGGEIVVLSDANTVFERSTVRNLVRWFADSAVAAVCGKLQLIDAMTGKNVDGLYWRYENFLKECEGRLGALLGANGAVYAIRRASYAAIPGDTIIDDFLIPLKIKLQTEGRLVYDPDALASEETPPRIRDEFRRRARIGAGGFQCLARLWRLALPTAGWTALAFLSHKVLRWVAPLLLIVAVVANSLLIADDRYRLLLALQAAFYVTGFLSGYVPGNGLAVRCLRLTGLFTSMNAALAVGFWRWLAGTQQAAWQRTAR
ncbi:MAG TPA: glycosyltransferase family 2 protein [Pirellulales bacterium]|jgi:cellulose synthase/poly-beta-1,6-N-acetylglucosamine synthase-like glycosyltransferase